MKVEINLIPSLHETIIKIETPEITKEIQQLFDRLNHPLVKSLPGIKNEKIFILNVEDIYYFFCENQKVYANCGSEKYEIRQRLYEVENILKNSSFIRISKSVIANANKMKNLEMSFNGSMCVYFKNNSKEFISRKYVKNIKNYFSIGGK